MRGRLPGIPALATVRALVIAMLLRPPGDFAGAYGEGRRRRYVYRCRRCEKLLKVIERFEEGEEPPCRVDRRHGPVVLRSVE